MPKIIFIDDVPCIVVPSETFILKKDLIKLKKLILFFFHFFKFNIIQMIKEKFYFKTVLSELLVAVKKID